MALVHDKPSVCEDCGTHSMFRKRRPLWMRLFTPGKRLYRCSMCNAWRLVGSRMARNGQEDSTEFPATFFPPTNVPTIQAIPPYVTQVADADRLAGRAPAAPLSAPPVQGELSFDGD